MSSTIEQRPLGVHLVGSVPFSSADEVFRHVNKVLGGHVLRIPDGETGTRWNFARWQYDMLPKHTVLDVGSPDLAAQLVELVPEEEIAQMVGEMQNFETRYDEAAIESYGIFKKLKNDGLIRKDVRFQVSLPTPLNVISFLRPPYRAAVEPFYEAALLRTLARIQAKIPAAELAIQWDMAIDMGMIEGLPWIQPWFEGPTLDGVVERAVKLANKVEGGVDMGFHLCYGDAAHKHFLEPESTAAMVNVTNAILNGVKRPGGVQWIHMPVPKARNDVEYFVPLRGLRLPSDTMLYLGLVHVNDYIGTMSRIKTAQQAGFSGRFGVATECGMGRTPVADLDSIFQISKDVSDAVV